MPEAKPNKPKFLDMIIITGLLVAAFGYLVISFNTRDLLWFWPVFEEQPRQMTVYCYGSEVQVRPGSAFQKVNEAVNQALSGRKRWDQLTMSDETYQEYLSTAEMMVLELVYDPTVRVHSFYAFYKNVNTFIIPLDGRHANTNAFFGLRGDFILSGSLHVTSNAPILEAVEASGICQRP